MFAGIIQNVIEELQAGKTTALSYVMHDETLRVLGDVPTLVLPGSQCFTRGDGHQRGDEVFTRTRGDGDLILAARLSPHRSDFSNGFAVKSAS